MRLRFIAALTGLIIGAGSDARSIRRERQFDFVLGLSRAEYTLPPEGKRPVLIGDSPIDTDDDRIEAMVSVGTELRFGDVPVHPGAHLRYAVGPSKLHPHEPTSPVRCTLALDKSDGARVVLEEFELSAAKEPKLRAGSIDLAALRGSRGTLVCATSGGDDREFVAWSQLLLASDGRSEAPHDRIVEHETVAVDLSAAAGEVAARTGAIELPVPGVFRTTVLVPERALLRLFVGVPAGLTEGEKPELGVKVRVSLDDEVLVEQLRVRRSVASEAFRAYEDVDLSAYAGREVALALEVQPRGQHPPARALLGLPRILQRRAVERAARANGAPDLFVIVVDTLRADALGCYGSRRPTSPRLDELARSSLVFERAWSQSCWTLPSTATLLTGLDPDEHGVTGPNSSWLHDDVETLAEALSARGFTCGALVANSLVSEANHFDQGFENFAGLNWSNARKVVTRTLEWLDQHEHDRVFAYLHLIDPHAPYAAPLKPDEAFDVPGNSYAGRTFDELLQHFGGEEGLRSRAELAEAVARARSLYDGEVRYVDRWLGVLLDGLRERGRLESSVLLVTADHGEEFLDHGDLFHGHHLYEESVRVPFLLRAPGLAPGRETAPIDGCHVKPLLLDLLDSRDDPDAHARAHLPSAIRLVTDRARESLDSPSRREAIVRWPWKLIVTPDLDREELFDLSRDPGEHVDHRADEKRVLDAMRGLLESARRAPATGPGRRWSPDSGELLERMRELGYVR